MCGYFWNHMPVNKLLSPQVSEKQPATKARAVTDTQGPANEWRGNASL